MKKLSLLAIITLMCAAQVTAETVPVSKPGAFSWNLACGGGSAAGPNRSTAFQVGSGFVIGAGRNLSLGISGSYTRFAGTTPNDASYFADIPLSLTGYFVAGGSLPMAVSGGVGAGFSDLREWRKSNRALTGHIAVAANIHEQFWTELRMVKAATSTGNVTFGFLVLRYSIGL